MDNLESAPAPLILTVKLDPVLFALFDALRQKHFPPERNFLSAHVTLFHHLPGSRFDEIATDLREICARNEIFPLRFPSVRFLGKGTAIEIESAELIDLRAELKNRWNESLGNQDRQKFKPHITIQNKVAPDKARHLFDELSKDWKEQIGTAVGIELWHYLNGPWKLAGEFLFER